MSNVIPQKAFYDYPVSQWIIPFFALFTLIGGILTKSRLLIMLGIVVTLFSIPIIIDIYKHCKRAKKEKWKWNGKEWI